MFRGKKVVVVMPAYNAAETLRTTHDEVMAQGIVDHVILVDDASQGLNVMPAIMDAVKAYASVGEMTNALVSVYGRYDEPVRF